VKSRFERAGIPKQGFDNYIVLLVTVKCCKTNSTFSLRMINISILLKRPLLKTQKQLQTRWISRFRRIVEYLADPAQHSIKKDVDFIIERASSFDYIPKRGEKPLILTKTETKLFYKLLKSTPGLPKEVSKRQGEEVIGATTIRNYLKSKKYFIGLFGSRRMG
jgi:hypothetical protein